MLARERERERALEKEERELFPHFLSMPKLLKKHKKKYSKNTKVKSLSLSPS